MTAVFSEVKRVLRNDGTLWLNIGDTYSSSKKGDNRQPEDFTGQVGALKSGAQSAGGSFSVNSGIQSKCLCMIPERLAWSLIQDGWTLRNKNVWYKPNAMPSSVKDRFSNKWEYVFMFSKSQKYYFDLDAVREPIIESQQSRPRMGNRGGKDTLYSSKWANVPGQQKQSIAKHSGYYDEDGNCLVDFEKGKNPGDVFIIPTCPFPEAHFAVFPEKLCEKPIKAGCPEQVCKKCGKARERIIEKHDTGLKQKMPDYWDSRQGSHFSIHREGREKGKTGVPITINKTVRFSDCGCKAGFNGGIVLDPFCGAGTVLYVAKETGRKFIGIDIKQEFCEMSEKRTSQGVL